MKTNREKLKAEYMAEAEELFDQLMEWDEQTSKPDLTQIEEIVLHLRQRIGEQMAQAVLARQESRQPAERMSCAQCGGELEPKGQKGNQVESRLGDLRVERSYYYCPGCRQGFFPSGSATETVGETLE
jgi:uncharacterized protein with PIN domain